MKGGPTEAIFILIGFLEGGIDQNGVKSRYLKRSFRVYLIYLIMYRSARDNTPPSDSLFDRAACAHRVRPRRRDPGAQGQRPNGRGSLDRPMPLLPLGSPDHGPGRANRDSGVFDLLGRSLSV